MLCPACRTHNEDSVPVCFSCGRALAPPLARGSELAARYEILSFLGEGGMGMVYRAQDRVLDEVVAIKILRPAVAQDPEMARRFRSEIRLARKVRHENVCAIHEYGEDGAVHFIAMEYVDGVDLRRVLRKSGHLPPQEAFQVAVQVCRGLEAIHEAGIVHRDIKPSNIMRDRRGAVRLMDFGIAKQLGTDVTLGPHLIGTPDYMSPEQAQSGKVDFRSDVYSLGIVIFEIFTGRVPFKGDSVLSTILMHINDPPPLDDARAQPIPEPLRPVLRKVLEKDPALRCQSATEMLRALRGAYTTAAPTLSVPAILVATRLGAVPETDSEAPTVRLEPPRAARAEPDAVPTGQPPRLERPAGRQRALTWRRGAALGVALAVGLFLLWVLRLERVQDGPVARPAPGDSVSPRAAPAAAPSAEPLSAAREPPPAPTPSAVAPTPRSSAPRPSPAAKSTAPARTEAPAPGAPPPTEAHPPTPATPTPSPPPLAPEPSAPFPPADPDLPILCPATAVQPRWDPANRLPVYPREMAGTGVDGEVVLKVVVSRTGEVTDVEVLAGGEPFASAALAVARGWRYTPALVDGRPRSVYLNVRVPFRAPRRRP